MTDQFAVKPLAEAVTTHARLCSASGAHRWHPCNGSAFLSLGYPNVSNEYARDGQAGHHVGATCINSDGMFDAADYVGKEIMVDHVPTLFTEENAEFTQVYIDVIREEQYKWGEMHIEKTLNLQPITKEPHAVCTPDALFLRLDNNVSDMAVYDLKLGRTPVYAKGNLQEILYYAAALQAHNHRYHFARTLKEVTLAIVQPKISSMPDVWTEDYRAINSDYLIPMQKSAWNIVNNIKDKNTALKFLNPGEKQCEWCLFRTDCPALAKQVYAVHDLMFNDETATPIAAPEKITPAQLADVLDKADMIRSFLDACEARGLQEALQGNPPQGFKLVEGKPGNRAWADEEKVHAALLEGHNGDAERVDSDYFDHELKSPAQLEKALKKYKRTDIWQDVIDAGLIKRADGKPKLVREENPLPAITARVSFDDETQVIEGEVIRPEDLI